MHHELQYCSIRLFLIKPNIFDLSVRAPPPFLSIPYVRYLDLALVKPLHDNLQLLCRGSQPPPPYHPRVVSIRSSAWLRGSVVSASGPRWRSSIQFAIQFTFVVSWTRDPIENLTQSENHCLSVCMSLVKAFGVCRSHVDFNVTVLCKVLVYH